MYDKDLTIFSVFHQAYPYPDCTFIKPIQVGKSQSQLDLHFLTDDTGDNISEKNNRFCETTALYWIWKNLDQIDSRYIGLAHYRRYLTPPQIRVKEKLWGSKKIIDTTPIYNRPLSEEALNELASAKSKTFLLEKLSQSQILLPQASGVGALGTHQLNIEDQFIYYHLREDWLIFEQALQKLNPDDYAFAKTLFSSKQTMHCYNMFIADRAFVEAYCAWLFPILFELEKNIQVSPYVYQNRTIGFLSERLLNLYVYKNQLSVSEMPIVHFT